ncbi:hypothetical protein D9M71_493050 [compost metagenome]
MLQVGFAEIEQTLPGHGAVLDALFLGHQVEHRVHQAGFARRAAGLDQHRQRLIEFARHSGQIAGQEVAGLADHSAARQVGLDALDQVGGAQQVQGGFLVLGAERRGGILRGQRGLDRRLLQALQLEQQLAQVAFEDFFGHAQLAAGLFQIAVTGLGRVQVEAVHVIRGLGPLAGLAAHLHVDPHLLRAEVFLPAAHPPMAVGHRE